MANRHLSRSLAMQVLFDWDFNDGDTSKLDKVTETVVEEFGPGMDEISFVNELVHGVISHKDQLDSILAKAAPDWPIEQIAVVDRNILRLGLYELIFGDRQDVPAKVAINEAIELGKTFGGENSGRFINGVLGTVYKELGEPDKDQAPSRKVRKPEVAYEDMPIEKLGGAVVYCQDKNKTFIALVHDVFGYWTLPKGHIEEGGDVKVGTASKVKEEISVDSDIKEELGTNEYIASDPEKGKIRRQVIYFLAECKVKKVLKLEEKNGLDNVGWFAIEEVADLRMYDDVLPIITKAIKILMAK
ncbi:MAG: transcription antitermination factor NusB [Candidatus Vogelbacteria bacterium]|nr:transcription antitermination factor NusB [Candidatus Vogelbacteria bacterium]